jgi:hypothetical protein
MAYPNLLTQIESSRLEYAHPLQKASTSHEKLRHQTLEPAQKPQAAEYFVL